MTLEERSKNTKKKPFKLTKELIRLALNDGWTQTDIATKCRTQQSIVSAWKKGLKLANEQQLYLLLEIYGHKLRRKTFKVYWTLNTEKNEKVFHRVEGKVILSQAFYDPRRDQSGKLLKKIPIYKLVIHHQGSDQFRPVIQHRLRFSHSNEELECSIADAVWSSEISDRMSTHQLINFIDNYATQKLEQFPSDANTLPFLLRQTLLNHGFPVEDVALYPAIW